MFPFSFAMANSYIDHVGKVDVITDAEVWLFTKHVVLSEVLCVFYILERKKAVKNEL